MLRNIALDNFSLGPVPTRTALNSSYKLSRLESSSKFWFQPWCFPPIRHLVLEKPVALGFQFDSLRHVRLYGVVHMVNDLVVRLVIGPPVHMAARLVNALHPGGRPVALAGFSCLLAKLQLANLKK